MDSDLSRLCAIPGTHDISLNEAAEVLQVSMSYMQRCVRRGALEVKRYQGRGETAHRVRIPRAAIVRYLVKISSGDKSVILAAVAAQCPQYLHAAQAVDSAHSGEEVPTNVIQMHGKKVKGGQGRPEREHPGQMFLFEFPVDEKATA